MNELCSLGSDVVYCCILHCCTLCISMINIVTDDMTSALHFSVRIYRCPQFSVYIFYMLYDCFHICGFMEGKIKYKYKYKTFNFIVQFLVVFFVSPFNLSDAINFCFT
jgi:hypothetical protein